ncbi:hypothetical protein [Leuconostoc gelidum]|uniref:hypothetical protein n=1 Tax=Leuconostoc gelidum TaxID=1244 RepID=UPI000219378C|nr:hypothetical protein [Leuconostoc gelidum]AFS39860.1 hypothetical protein C269_02075 [Leuconostoc gelidum JB7]MBZ5992027.1 hypothetical protein [Leuconostoc gelidum subsp. gelidum]USP16981.1 hypothetical protein J4766_08335 [Leuconostoc gelidum subsp. aenigmaticum]GMA66846.1 hypothetical protein GCM10025884_04730 [Leuconostoc gelidum subsp. gelidum]
MVKDDSIYYWCTKVNWNIQESNIIIGTFRIKGFPLDLFLKFYQLSEKLKQSYTPGIDKILLGLLTNATKELVLGTYIFGETNFQRMIFLYKHKYRENEFKDTKKVST